MLFILCNLYIYLLLFNTSFDGEGVANAALKSLLQVAYWLVFLAVIYIIIYLDFKIFTNLAGG